MTAQEGNLELNCWGDFIVHLEIIYSDEGFE